MDKCNRTRIKDSMVRNFRTLTQGILLEDLENDGKTLRGVIKAVIYSLFIEVFVRFTLDGWKTFDDCIGVWNTNEWDRTEDFGVFHFSIKWPKGNNDSTMEFSPWCRYNGMEEWDNNEGKNYLVHQSIRIAPDKPTIRIRQRAEIPPGFRPISPYDSSKYYTGPMPEFEDLHLAFPEFPDLTEYFRNVQEKCQPEENLKEQDKIDSNEKGNVVGGKLQVAHFDNMEMKISFDGLTENLNLKEELGGAETDAISDKETTAATEIMAKGDGSVSTDKFGIVFNSEEGEDIKVPIIRKTDIADETLKEDNVVDSDLISDVRELLTYLLDCVASISTRMTSSPLGRELVWDQVDGVPKKSDQGHVNDIKLHVHGLTRNQVDGDVLEHDKDIDAENVGDHGAMHEYSSEIVDARVSKQMQIPTGSQQEEKRVQDQDTGRVQDNEVRELNVHFQELEQSDRLVNDHGKGITECQEHDLVNDQANKLTQEHGHELPEVRKLELVQEQNNGRKQDQNSQMAKEQDHEHVEAQNNRVSVVKNTHLRDQNDSTLLDESSEPVKDQNIEGVVDHTNVLVKDGMNWPVQNRDNRFVEDKRNGSVTEHARKEEIMQDQGQELSENKACESEQILLDLGKVLTLEDDSQDQDITRDLLEIDANITELVRDVIGKAVKDLTSELTDDTQAVLEGPLELLNIPNIATDVSNIEAVPTAINAKSTRTLSTSSVEICVEPAIPILDSKVPDGIEASGLESIPKKRRSLTRRLLRSILTPVRRLRRFFRKRRRSSC